MSEQIAEHKIDRTGWPSGPWDSEPDRVQFAHAGLACLLVRNHMGAWCGYVGVPEEHPDFKKEYDNVDVKVHGGLTYANLCQGGICHVPDPGMPETVWWLGFDCGHCDDLMPGFDLPSLRHRIGAYRTQAYVEREVRNLAVQLARRGKHG